MTGQRALPTWWYGVGATVLTIATLFVAFAVVKPTPPRTVVISAGPAGSVYHDYAQRYRQSFAENGIDLVIRESAGVTESLASLNDPDSDVEVAFVSMGLATTGDFPELRSLGGMFFEPIWVFNTTPTTSTTSPSELTGMRIAVGPAGGLAHLTAMRLLELVELSTTENELLYLEPSEAAEQLRSGEIEIAIFATSADTPEIQELLASEVVDLTHFSQADAYIARFPALTKLIVPAGVGSIARRRPAEDVATLAFTGALFVRESLHPAIQSLLLDAATEVHSAPDMFHTVARFPQAEAINIPLSDSADQFYRSGKPFLYRYLPFWLAVLAVQLLAIILPLLGIVYPVVRLFPATVGWAVRRRITRLYGELRLIEIEAAKTKDAEQRARLAADLESLDERVRALRLPESFAAHVYTLRTLINVVRGRFADS